MKARHPRGRAARRAARLAGECRVPALRRALGLPHPRLPAVPREDQGQGRAPGALPARELPLRPRVPRRRRSQRAGARTGSTTRGECARARHDAGAPARALRARRARRAPAARAAAVSRRWCLDAPARRRGRRARRAAASAVDRRAAPAAPRTRALAGGARMKPAAPSRSATASARSSPISRCPARSKRSTTSCASVDGGALPAPRRDRAAPRRADRAAQQSPAAGRDALLAAAGGEDARRLRLQLPAVAQARADREPAHARLPRAPGERRLPRPAGRRQDAPRDQPRHRRRAERAARLLRHARRPDHLARGGAGGRPARAAARRRSSSRALLVVDEIGYLPISAPARCSSSSS